MRRPLVFILPLLVGALSVSAGNRAEFQLPLLDRSAASAALGEGGVTLHGLNALGVNPALLHTDRREVGTQFQQMPLDTTLGSAGLAVPLAHFNATVALHYATLRSAGHDRRDEQGRALGSFVHQDQMAGIHVSRALSAGVVGGVGAKYLASSIDGQRGSALAWDAGLQTRLSALPLSLGAAVLNLGRGPALAGHASDLPTHVNLSAGYQPMKSLNLLAGVSHYTSDGRNRASFGAEFDVAKTLTLRGRYALTAGGTGTDALTDLAGGLALRLGSATFDYAFTPSVSALDAAGETGTHRAALTVRF